MSLVAYMLTKLRILKDLVRKMPRKSRFRRHYDQQHGKQSQTLLKSERQLFIIFIDQRERN